MRLGIGWIRGIKLKSNEMYTYGMVAEENTLWMINYVYNYIFMYDIDKENI